MANPNVEDDRQWSQWPASETLKSFTDKLVGGIESNDFSRINLEDMPIATAQIARAAQRSPKELLEEALGFSIMGRNCDLVMKLLAQMRDRKDLDDSGLYPFHLAATFLDGSKQCCEILDTIQEIYPLSLRKLYVNDLGHTVLDSLMMNILKAHTSCSPAIVDAVFKKDKRFEGEDVDICGRWDADSDCFRTLLANGTPGIPFEWKHMFCHTSIQAICHGIGTIFGPNWGPDINMESGLFLKRCSHCGTKLQLLPLHTLILIGLHLAESGCKDETLFGILACLLCLLSNGAYPLLKANISMRALLNSEETEDCTHELLGPVELANKIENDLIWKWSPELATGWRVICRFLSLSQGQWDPLLRQRHDKHGRTDSDDLENDWIELSEDEMSVDGDANDTSSLPAKCFYDDCEFHRNFFGTSRILASLWAAVQTELLTYRRISEGDPWLSTNFDLTRLEGSLDRERPPDIALIQKGMMKPFCDCGEFLNATPACACVDEASCYYFSNMDDWNRSSFISTPEDRSETWYNK